MGPVFISIGGCEPTLTTLPPGLSRRPWRFGLYNVARQRYVPQGSFFHCSTEHWNFSQGTSLPHTTRWTSCMLLIGTVLPGAWRFWAPDPGIRRNSFTEGP